MFALGARTTSLSVVILLFALYHDSTLGLWIFKPLASLGFLLASVDAPKPSSMMRIGLVLAALGDVLLISEKTFEAGLFSFLVGHIFYTLAFAQYPGFRPFFTTLSTIPLACVVFPVHAYLQPYVEGEMQIPVAAYMLVVSIMVAFSFGTKNATCITGALLFYVSDLTVARDQFVLREWANKAVGLPMYYGAQLLLAWTMQ
ncbi:YhhN-like protein [Myriangium duriaei CBS 260.36]|uniref:YhhN-like protein n=1 Tax=Myriangium duriaei CBS 260.36 TaxID=1168546 RepID=A0A9P4ISC2_9PEZI|nr:YhhN-like protein [Myriangium duriaei CBS 260.36]